MECPGCGNPVRPEAKYCPRCGANVEALFLPGAVVADADLSIVTRTLLAKLTKAQLAAEPKGEAGLTTGIDGIELERLDTQVRELDEPGSEKAFEASVELVATLTHPAYGEAEVRDLVSARDHSADAALAGCAETYWAVTFSALRSLFEGDVRGGPRRSNLEDSTLGSDGSSWDFHNGHLQVLGDARPAVMARLRKQPPPALVIDTLNRYLEEHRLHWCKLDVTRDASGLSLAVTIDGRRSVRGESELRSKLLERGEIAGDWEFRQFFVLGPRPA